MKDLYCKNCKTLMKEIEGDNIVKMSMLVKTIDRFDVTLIKTPMTIFTELEQIILKFIWSNKRS